jgi:hypothetical protein
LLAIIPSTAISPRPGPPTLQQSPGALRSAPPPRIIKVPADFKTIHDAVNSARDGDWIILAPGKYFEHGIDVARAVVISSEWKVSGDVTKIGETVIDAEDETLFNITADGTEISGLHIINGDHPLNIMANVTILHNHFKDNLDAMSFEGPGGGYAGYNTVENDRDDGLDVDIGSDRKKPGSDIRISYNTIINSHDDGMEIRLFSHPNQNIHYEISHNTIIGSKNAGIQLISYDQFTGKEFRIHHNIIRDCKAGLGCMEGSNTVENLEGASKMDELVSFYNNTLIGNQIGATGGNHILSVNNIVQANALGGFKKFGNRSAVVNNLFFQNGGEDLIGMDKDVVISDNIFSVDPLLDKDTFAPGEKSPCIDAGTERYPIGGAVLVSVARAEISGGAPDIGALEYSPGKDVAMLGDRLLVDAGDDLILSDTGDALELKGEVKGPAGHTAQVKWRLESGPQTADIANGDNISSRVTLRESGIYRFSFTASTGKQTSKDEKTVRFISGGKGNRSLLHAGNANNVEAEQVAYTYGKVWIAEDDNSARTKYVGMKKQSEQRAFAEYSLGIADAADFTLWLRVRNGQKNHSAVRATFMEKDSPIISVTSDKEWAWIKVFPDITLTGGEWPLLIYSEEGAVLVDKILFSPDKSFVPRNENKK